MPLGDGAELDRVTAAVTEALRLHCGPSERPFAPSASLADLSVNSLKLLRIIVEVQKTLRRPRLPIDRIGRLTTVEDLYRLFG